MVFSLRFSAGGLSSSGIERFREVVHGSSLEKFALLLRVPVCD